MRHQFSLSARPKTLDELIGQAKTVKQIRGHVKGGRVTKAWLFTGPRGTGKTTIARILALSLQCDHQTVFGTPCLACRKRRKEFDIVEYPSARLTGKDELDNALNGANYSPRAGNYRVYILDEVHRLTEQAQSLALHTLEDGSADTTIFILCSDTPQKIKDTIQRRCTLYKLRELDEEEIETLVVALLARVHSELPSDRLSMVLADKGVNAPGLVAQAVEKYLAGATPEEACEVEASTAVNTNALTKAITHGDWPSAAVYLKKAERGDWQNIQLGSISYMRKMLLNSPEIGARAKAISNAIDELVSITRHGDTMLGAALVAGVYRATEFFAKERR